MYEEDRPSLALFIYANVDMQGYAAIQLLSWQRDVPGPF